MSEHSPAERTEPSPRPAQPANRTLNHIRMLADVPPERLRQLEETVIWKSYEPNQTIFELDDQSTDVHFIARGKLRITIFSHAEGEAPSDSTVTLADLSTGETFGEIAAIDNRPRSARAVALDNCLIACLSAPEFIRLLEDCPRVAIALARRFAALVRSLNRRVHSLSTQTPAQRVYSELVRLAEPNPQGDGTWMIALLPAHGEIASWAGTEKEDVAQAIGQLAREGIVERRHKTLIIRHHARLRFLAHL